MNYFDLKQRKANLVCPIHGPYEGAITIIDGEEVESECHGCANDRSKEILANAHRIIHAAQERGIQMEKEKAAAIPKRFQGMSFKSWIAKTQHAAEIKMEIGGFIKEFGQHMETGKSYLFSGISDTGKTHLACAVANNLLMKGHTARYVSSLSFISQMKQAWTPGSGLTEQAILNEFMKPDLLVIDELGKGEIGAKEKGFLFLLIDMRNQECLPMIGITNEPKEKLARILNQETVRRLYAGGGKHFDFNWEPFNG